jgi:hypothetical protein
LIQNYGNAPVRKPLNYTLNQLFGLTDAVVGGWKVAAIVSYHTGIWSTLGSSQ